jgi:hypothetical protein
MISYSIYDEIIRRNKCNTSEYQDSNTTTYMLLSIVTVPVPDESQEMKDNGAGTLTLR